MEKQYAKIETKEIEGVVIENIRLTEDAVKEFSEIYHKHKQEIHDCVIRAITLEIELDKSHKEHELTPEEDFNDQIMLLCGVYNNSVESVMPIDGYNEGIEKVTLELDKDQLTYFERNGAIGFRNEKTLQIAWVLMLKQFSATPQKEPEPSVEEILPQYVLRRNGDVWNIVFEGHELPPVRHLAGMTYIAELIKAKGMPISAADLYRIEHPPTGEALDAAHKDKDEIAMAYGTGGGTHKVYDAKTKAAIKQRIGEIQLLMKEADTPADQREVLEEELEKLEANSRAAGLKTGNGYESGASFEPPEIKQARQAVGAAIGRAIDAIDKATKDKELVRHLNNGFNRMSASPKYMGGFDWEL